MSSVSPNELALKCFQNVQIMLLNVMHLNVINYAFITFKHILKELN